MEPVNDLIKKTTVAHHVNAGLHLKLKTQYH